MSEASQSPHETSWSPAWDDADGADRAATLFRGTFGREPDGVWAAPGRVNLIGEHVDYCDGLTLPMALPHRTFVAFSARADDRISLVSNLDGTPWSGATEQARPGGLGGWISYAAGPAWALAQEAGLPAIPAGFDAAVASCVPLGAGLSSSAALECAMAVALDETWGLGLATDDAGRARLARACVRAENEVAGAPTGGMDQAASLRARSAHALLLDCRDDTVDQVPFALAADGLALLVIDTRAPHALVDGQYGERRATVEAAARSLGVRTLREAAERAEADPTYDPTGELDGDVPRRRTRHVVTEIARVREATALLRARDWHRLGPVLDASHASLRDDYEVTCPELDAAVEAAREAGALGARMTGGGFGGSAIAVIRAEEADEVAAAVAGRFAERGFAAPAFLLAEPSAGAERIR